ncbi:hypothetical protein [Brevibacterium linens]|uniref:hypothetical protein n=1 Tax=Brevibacterium linens TaxID=1703 RepID=UPI003F8A82C6
MRMKLKLSAVLVAAVFTLVGCGGGKATPEAGNVEQEATQETPSTEELEPCFTVGQVGSELSLDWEFVIASRGESDQPGYIQDVIYRVVDLYEELDYDVGCAGGSELRDFGEKLPALRDDAELGQDTDEQYQEIADLGNKILELSDDEGYEWDYKFVTSPSEIYP